MTDRSGLPLRLDELVVPGLLAGLDPGRPAFELLEAREGFAQLLAARLDLLTGLDRRAAQLVGAQPGRRGHETERVEGLLVLGDVLRHLRVLVAIGEIGVRLAHDVGERLGREDLLEERRVLRAVRLREPLPKGLTASPHVLFAALELLLEQAERPVALAQLVDQLGVPRPDAFETLDRELDPAPHLRLVGVDPAKLFGGVAQRRLGARLVAVQRPEDRLLPRDRAPELVLPLAGGLHLVGQARGFDRPRRARGHDQKDGEGQERHDGTGDARSSCSRDHARISAMSPTPPATTTPRARVARPRFTALGRGMVMHDANEAVLRVPRRRSPLSLETTPRRDDRYGSDADRPRVALGNVPWDGTGVAHLES